MYLDFLVNITLTSQTSSLNKQITLPIDLWLTSSSPADNQLTVGTSSVQANSAIAPGRGRTPPSPPWGQKQICLMMLMAECLPWLVMDSAPARIQPSGQPASALSGPETVACDHRCFCTERQQVKSPRGWNTPHLLQDELRSSQLMTILRHYENLIDIANKYLEQQQEIQIPRLPNPSF